MSFPKRVSPKLTRRKPTREPKAKFVIFCEGQNTEPAYLDALRRKYRNAIIEIRAGGGVPSKLADRAIQYAKSNGLLKRRKSANLFEESDQVWVMFDRDDHPRYAETVSRCADKGMNVAKSDPCFELWLILHYEDYHKLDERHNVQAHFSTLHPGYEPKGSKSMNCDELLHRLETAENRAEQQLHRRAQEGRPFGRPSTTVFELTRAIREAADRSKVLPVPP